MSETFLRTTYVYGDQFWIFYNGQTKAVQDKIDWIIGLVRILRVIPEKYFKHLTGTDGLYEMRIKVGSNIFRILCFFDKRNLIILLNGFHKKDEKTPKAEIEKAERLKKKYYEEQQSK